MKKKTLASTVLSIIIVTVVILALFGAGMTFLGLGRFNEITGTGLVVGICFLLLAIELTVKSSIEKKEATDEES